LAQKRLSSCLIRIGLSHAPPVPRGLTRGRAGGRQAKAREIDKMDERATRLAEVLQELGSQEPVERFALAPCEEPGRALQVTSADITVEKHLSAAERVAAEQAAREEVARQAAAGKDDQAGRALLVCLPRAAALSPPLPLRPPLFRTQTVT
jgi:hypothetical protein